MSILSPLLSPQFLVQNIPEISIMIGAVLLILFSDFVDKGIVLPLSDSIRRRTKKTFRVKTRIGQVLRNWFAVAASAGVFLVYIYFVEFVLAEYVFEPILYKLRPYILIVVVVLFSILAYVLGTPRIRRKFMNV